MFGAFRPTPNINQWLATMGANTSKVDMDLTLFPGERDASSTRSDGQRRPGSTTSSHHTSSHPAPISSNQGLRRKALTSSVHTSSRATSPSTSHRSTYNPATTVRREPLLAPATSPHNMSTAVIPVLPATMLSELPSHKRPLPPPESRDTIMSQVARVCGWKMIDDDIYESCRTGESTHPESEIGLLAKYDSGTTPEDLDAKPVSEGAHVAESTSHQPLPLDRAEPGTNVPLTASTLPLAEPTQQAGNASLPSTRNQLTTPFSFPVTKPKPQPAEVAAPSRKRKSSHSPEPMKKKRRLILTARAVAIANQDHFIGTEDNLEIQVVKKSEFGFTNPFPDGFPLTEEEEWLLPESHPGCCLYQDSDHEDEDHWAQIVKTSETMGGESAEERDDRRMKLLARFHDHNAPSKSTDSEEATSVGLSERDLLLKQAREYMLKEQEAGAERSRQLREKALQRRGLLEVPSSSSSSEQDKTFSSSDGDDTPTTDLFSDADGDIDMEHLLDIAQEYANKDARPAQNTITSQRPNTEFNSLNPASRAAAEQFRTQSRHLSGDDHKPSGLSSQDQPTSSRSLSDSHLPSQGAHLEERERRLLEAKKSGPAGSVDTGRGVSSPTPGVDFTRGDLGSRTPVSGLQKHSELRFEADRARYGSTAGTGLRPRSLIDRISSYRKVDEDYNEESSDTFPGVQLERKDVLPTQRLSGLESLAIKRRTADIHQHDVKSSTRPLSGFEMLAAKREAERNSLQDAVEPRREDPADDMISTAGITSNNHDASNTSHPRPAFAPARSRGLTLPKSFPGLSEADKENVVQHEIAKERKRDLDVLGEVFWEFALLRCLKNRELSEQTMTCETKELHDTGEFIAIVIDQNKSGKMRRARMQQIRDNIRRRAEKALRYAQEPTDVAIQTEMVSNWSAKRVEFVHNEVTNIQKVIDHYGDLRKNSKDTRKSSVRKSYTRRESEGSTSRKQVRFDDGDDDEEPSEYSIPSRPAKAPKRPKAPKRGGNATENRRQAQYDRLDKEEAKIRELLKQFNTAPPEQIEDLQTELAETEAEVERLKQQEDSESEEDEGAEYVFGAGREARKKSLPNQDINEINRLEDERQKEAGIYVSLDQPKPRQAVDYELVRQMQIRVAERLAQAEDPSIIPDKEAAVAADSDSDSETVCSSDSEDEVDRQVFKYTLYGAFRGIPGYEDADHYRIMGSYDYDQVQTELLRIIAGVQGQLSHDTLVDSRNWSCNTIVREGLMEQHLMLGANVDHEARVWVEKNLVDLSKSRFRKAKRQRAIVERFNYVIHWQKQIVPVIEEAEEVTEKSDNVTKVTTTQDPLDAALEEGYEALFGTLTPEPEPEPESEPEPSQEITITEVSRDEIDENTYSCPVSAARFAKDKLLAFYNNYYPELEYEGMRRVEDESIEQYVEGLGDFGLFDKTYDKFEKVETYEDGTERKIEETFRVWVKEIAVKGPGN